MLFTVSQLKAVMPNSGKRASIFHPHLMEHMEEFEITEKEDVCCFIATIAVESGELRYTTELWGPTAQQRKYEPPSRKAENLGNTEPGDGYRFRGRGLIQVTGRYNYSVLSGKLHVDYVAHPEWLSDPKDATRSACCWWHANDCSEIALLMGIEGVSRKVNLGNEYSRSTPNHLPQRIKYYEAAVKEFIDFSNVESGVSYYEE